ncbi:MAG: hypothetical protein UR23_C0039G0002 [Candidatus Roizmanbacteria bacterium GW2011_GWA2_32_13]|uniref:Uncharacterized protein n=1 Tax=Candidatus Roizmanbacteria bacterium GW2011_GWA2_32_13 TaxID=1618475 RepID=A0A0F9Z6U6_9BACT|nr:MAG: hypothetical protein UR23_C0039G0002 [Candidatus Roizmanbacteria bacterium GW2011_GWA2_32_13]
MKNNKNPNKKDKITTEDILDFAKTYEDLKPFFALFIHYFKFTLDSEREIKVKIEEIQKKTQKNLKEDLFLKELWVLRYSFLHLWFFELKPPKNQSELEDELLAINSALKSALKDGDKLDYLLWLEKGFSEYAGIDELRFSDLRDFNENFPDKLAEKMAHIAFESTEGRLGGELHDFVTELMMVTIQKDRKVFELNDDISLTEREIQSVKDIISGMKPSKKDIDNFVDSLVEDEDKAKLSQP